MVKHVAIFPASHYIRFAGKMQQGLTHIQEEMEQQVRRFTAEGQLLEASACPAHRYDKMLQEVGMQGH